MDHDSRDTELKAMRGVTEVPEEQVSMVEEIMEISQRDWFFNSAQPALTQAPLEQLLASRFGRDL